MPNPIERPVVLVVEDGIGTRQLSCLVLESYGFVCREAASAEDAEALLQQDARIDLIFADIHLPGGMSGVDLAATASIHHRIPALLTSGLAIEYVEEVLPEGVSFLEKPYTPEQLLAAVQNVIKRIRGSHSGIGSAGQQQAAVETR